MKFPKIQIVCWKPEYDVMTGKCLGVSGNKLVIGKSQMKLSHLGIENFESVNVISGPGKMY